MEDNHEFDFITKLSPGKPPPFQEGPATEEILKGKLDGMIYLFGIPWQRGEKARLARAVGVSRQYITELTSGRRKASPEMAERLYLAAQTLNIWSISPKSFTGADGRSNAKFDPWNKRWQMIQKQERAVRNRSFLPTPDEAIRIKSELLTGYCDAIKNPKSCLNRYAKRLRRLMKQARLRLAEYQSEEDADRT